MLILFAALLPVLFGIAIILAPILLLYQFFHTGNINFLYFFFITLAIYAFIHYLGKSEKLQKFVVVIFILLWVNEEYGIYNPNRHSGPGVPLPNQKYFSYINNNQQQILVELKRNGQYKYNFISAQELLPDRQLQELTPFCQPLSDIVLEKFQRREMVDINVPVQCSDFISSQLRKRRFPVLFDQVGSALQEETEEIVVEEWFK